MTVPLSQKARWVDFHCHLDLYPDHERLIAECDAAGVATLAVTTTPMAWDRNKIVAEGAAHVRVALGLHPQLAAERENEISLFERLLPQTRYVGEVGLDGSRGYYQSFDAQERVFSRVLRACAEHGDKILTVHSLRAASKVLQHIEKNMPPGTGKAVMHWFTGSISEARRAVEMGCYFSINSSMLDSPRLRTVITQLPVERLLTETDGPFRRLSGVAVRPKDVCQTIVQLGLLLGRDQDGMAAQVLCNLSTLLKR